MTTPLFLWTVSVPIEIWDKAKEYLTAEELSHIAAAERVVIVPFEKESDARAFTGLIRDDFNRLIPIARAEAQ